MDGEFPPNVIEILKDLKNGLINPAPYFQVLLIVKYWMDKLQKKDADDDDDEKKVVVFEPLLFVSQDYMVPNDIQKAVRALSLILNHEQGNHHQQKQASVLYTNWNDMTPKVEEIYKAAREEQAAQAKLQLIHSSWFFHQHFKLVSELKTIYFNPKDRKVYNMYQQIPSVWTDHEENVDWLSKNHSNYYAKIIPSYGIIRFDKFLPFSDFTKHFQNLLKKDKIKVPDAYLACIETMYRHDQLPDVNHEKAYTFPSKAAETFYEALQDPIVSDKAREKEAEENVGDDTNNKAEEDLDKALLFVDLAWMLEQSKVPYFAHTQGFGKRKWN